MSRPRKDFGSKERNAKHEQALARRRERRHEARTLELASKAAEGEADFAALVEEEKVRMGKAESQQAKAGSKSPKSVATARDNLTRAFDLMGGVAALVVWGRQNPTEFYRLWARLIPRESMELSASLPLEDLLAKLSSHGSEGQTVSEAAWELGAEMLEEARARAEREDMENSLGTPQGSA